MLVDKESDRLPVDTSKFLEFDRIYATLARFALGNKRLWAPQLPGDLKLAESGLPAGFPQPSAKLPVPLTIGGILQCGWDYSDPALGIPN
jgi:hypothetical protein